jgi:hypothetical protein
VVDKIMKGNPLHLRCGTHHLSAETLLEGLEQANTRLLSSSQVYIDNCRVCGATGRRGLLYEVARLAEMCQATPSARTCNQTESW